MPKQAKQLSSLEVKRLTRPGVHAVGGVAGLLLQVKPTGARSFILRVMVGGKRRDIGLGGFPEVTLKEARERARADRAMIREGRDPALERGAARDALRLAASKRMTFDEAAILCHTKKAQEFRNLKHSNDWINSISNYASPVIGSLPIDQIELAHIVKVLEPIWITKTETASRLRQRIESVLAWATVSGYRSGDNPARWAGNLKEVLPAASKVKKKSHFRALPWQEVGGFMADLREREGLSARALEFSILTAARSGEVRLATWDEIDLDAKLWTIPAERMKSAKAHKIPLSVPALKLLRNSPRFADSPYVFPSSKGGPLSDMSLSAVCRRMEVDAVPHGFRSSFKDWARSSTAYPDEVSELALAHVSSDATRAAYARDELLPKRTRLMRDWAKFCGTVQPKGEVVPIGRSKRG